MPPRDMHLSFPSLQISFGEPLIFVAVLRLLSRHAKSLLEGHRPELKSPTSSYKCRNLVTPVLASNTRGHCQEFRARPLSSSRSFQRRVTFLVLRRQMFIFTHLWVVSESSLPCQELRPEYTESSCSGVPRKEGSAPLPSHVSDCVMPLLKSTSVPGINMV